jgi:hypothetical protein
MDSRYSVSYEHYLSEPGSPGNRDDLAVSALSTRVSDSDRNRALLDVLDSVNRAGCDVYSDREGWKSIS